MALERILIVESELYVRKTLEDFLRGKRYCVSSAENLGEAEKVLKRQKVDLVVLDIELPDGDATGLIERLARAPDRPLIVVMTAGPSLESAVRCMQLGAFDYLPKPFGLGQVEVLVSKAAAHEQTLKVQQYLASEFSNTGELIGNSPAMLQLRELVREVAPTNATVLVSGENGAGKELVANEIYKLSSRSHAPYIKVNCAAVPEPLIESELFGHEQGSLADAAERSVGRFELADGGTLLLEEIGRLSPGAQAKFLRVLQKREFERVGGTKTIKTDVRVIASTSRDLKRAVSAGEFREDLYYRLNVFPLQVPALRERKEDIPLLAEAFLQRAARKYGVEDATLTECALDLLRRYDWPGNVRELQNAIERALILMEGQRPLASATLSLLLPSGLIAHVPSPGHEGAGAPAIHVAAGRLTHATPGAPELGLLANGAGSILPLEEVEKQHILRALEFTNGNRTRAAALLHISIRTLRNKLNEYKVVDGA
jgi:two-component system, NtrC family, response regulator AtoC